MLRRLINQLQTQPNQIINKIKNYIQYKKENENNKYEIKEKIYETNDEQEIKINKMKKEILESENYIDMILNKFEQNKNIIEKLENLIEICKTIKKENENEIINQEEEIDKMIENYIKM